MYGGELFQEIQMRANKEFCNMPPPEQSCLKTKVVTYTNTNNNNNNNNKKLHRQASPNRNMNAYYNFSGGCFDGDGLIEKISRNGLVEKIAVRKLKKGDRVSCGDG